MNQTLIWGQVSEFLQFLRPLINITKIRRFLKRSFALGKKKRMSTLPLHLCQICHDNSDSSAVGGNSEIIVPYSASPCGHAFCYYCISAAIQQDSRFECPRCGITVESIQQLIKNEIN